MYYGAHTRETAEKIIEQFQNPEALPAALAQIFMHRKDDTPCRKWSWCNQLLTHLAGTLDARGFHQWKEVNRLVKKGAKAFYILSPCVKFVKEVKDGEERSRQAIIGFKSTPVFRFEDTEGEPLAGAPSEDERYLQALPLREVAEKWAITIGALPKDSPCLGYFSYKLGGEQLAISLAVQNYSTWTHELVHASDYMLTQFEGKQKWMTETVAEFGGAIILKCMNLHREADLGGAYEYITRMAECNDIPIMRACNMCLDRTCRAVNHIFTTYDEILESRANATAAA